MARNYEDLKAKIRGPVFPIVTPFTETHDVDYEALADYSEFLVDNGIPVLLVTVGTSRFNLLTGQEMLAVNETVVKAAAGRAMVIVAGPGPVRGSSRENIEFAQHAQSIGADAILVLYPERWYGDEPVIQFFHDVADSTKIGVMIHAVPMRDGFGGVKALKYLNADLLDQIIRRPNIIGIKEENGDRAIFEEILARHKKQCAIIGAGGAMRRFINDSKLGSVTYLVGVGSFQPKLAVRFYQVVMNGDLKTAQAIAGKNEDPYFNFAVKLGWHRVLKETLHLLNLMPPYERSPFNRITPQQQAELRQVMVQCGWLGREK